MKIKLDENLSRYLKPALVTEGHQASTAADEGLLGKTDEDVAAAAAGEGMMAFTLDLEFGNLRKYPPGPHAGVVLFRPHSMGPKSVATFVLDFVRRCNAELTGAVVVVDPDRVRVRRKPILE